MKSSGNTTRSQDARAIWENARVQRRNKEPDDTATWNPVHIATLPSATAHDRLPSSATSAVVVLTIPASGPCERLQICDPVVPGAGECPSHLRTPEERTACAVWHALGAGNDRAAAVPRAAPEAQGGGEVVVVQSPRGRPRPRTRQHTKSNVRTATWYPSLDPSHNKLSRTAQHRAPPRQRKLPLQRLCCSAGTDSA